jgi:hypothetical protein
MNIGRFLNNSLDKRDARRAQETARAGIDRRRSLHPAAKSIQPKPSLAE